MGRQTTISEEQAEQEIRARWPKDEALRAEFGDLEACVAYHKAEVRGVVKRTGAKVLRVAGKRA